MDKQTSMSFFTDELAEVKTHKKEFLEQMDQLIPWSEWAGMIKPCYYKGERGNKPYDLELMLRLCIADAVQRCGYGSSCGSDRQPGVF